MNEPERTSGKAVAALVLGLASLGCNFLTAIPALVVGLLALREIGNSEGRVRGRLLALIGLLVAVVSLVCVAPLGGLGGWWGYTTYEKARADKEKRAAEERIEGFVSDAKDNLHQIGLALHAYHDANFSLPPAAAGNAALKQPPVSWRVLLLPYIDEVELYTQYNQFEPWDGPNNSKLLSKMPKLYALPGDTKAPPGHTYYQGIVSAPESPPHAAFFKSQGLGVRFTDFTDGTSNTLLIVEAAEPVPWTKPADLELKPAGVPQLGWHYNDSCNVLMADGSVHTLPRSISPTTLRALITRNGGEFINEKF
jgi:prepilin-type processing-associated H-X9-DG protein